MTPVQMILLGMQCVCYAEGDDSNHRLKHRCLLYNGNSLGHNSFISILMAYEPSTPSPVTSYIHATGGKTGLQCSEGVLWTYSASYSTASNSASSTLSVSADEFKAFLKRLPTDRFLNVSVIAKFWAADFPVQKRYAQLESSTALVQGKAQKIIRKLFTLSKRCPKQPRISLPRER